MRRSVRVQMADFPADSQPLAAPQIRPRDAAGTDGELPGRAGTQKAPLQSRGELQPDAAPRTQAACVAAPETCPDPAAGGSGRAPHSPAGSEAPASAGRRRFLGTLSGAATTLAMGAAGLGPLAAPVAADDDRHHHHDDEDKEGKPRARRSFMIRREAAEEELDLGTPPHPSNGDEALYPDKCATYTKALPHDTFGRVDLNAYRSFIHALTSGNPADFENIILGAGRPLTNPQSGLAFDLEGTDSHSLSVPAAPTMAGAQTAAEMVEMYWASLLRDVPFSQYGTSSTANAAAAELNGLSGYVGPRNGNNRVTTNELFRGGFPGETLGPYVSQFMVLPTFFGQQPISQEFATYAPNIDYMTDFASYLTVQNGGSTGQVNQVDSQLRFLRDGRDLAAWTHVDVLYQGYFIALLVLGSIGAPVNPGIPYANSRTQAGFATFGGPHFAAMVGEMAARALERSWFQKWFVHVRARPEAAGAIAHLIKTGQGSNISCTPHSDLLNSQALANSFQKYGSYLLSQEFPEGSPTHPSYPTGHGVVAGACITLLKFFFDGTFVIAKPMVPSPNGQSLVPFSGPALTVNGELNKLGYNISFGHGIHAGIHYRSDTDSSLILGEATTLSILRDQAQTFNEKFTVSLTKFDGTTATISNSNE